MEASGVPLHCWGGSGIVRESVAGRKGGSVMGILVSVLGPVSSSSVEMAFVVDGRGGTSVAPTAKRRGTKRGGGGGLVVHSIGIPPDSDRSGTKVTGRNRM